MSLVELATYYDRFEADIVRGRLAAAGVEAVLFDAGLSAAYGAFPVRLMVLDDELEEARRVLAEGDP
jgi:hypothetical protein